MLINANSIRIAGTAATRPCRILRLLTLCVLSLIICIAILSLSHAADTNVVDTNAADTNAAEVTDKHNKANQPPQTTHNTAAEAAQSQAQADKADKAKNLAKLMVSIHGLDGVLQKNAEAFLDIWSERNKPVKNPPYIRFLSKSGVEQIKQALQPFGYYLSQVKLTLDEHKDAWQVTYRVDKGQPVKVQKTTIIIDGEGKDNAEFQQLLANYPLKTGDVLLQESYTGFKNKLVALATTEGYFDAQFTKKQIVLSDDLRSADIFLTYNTGKRYTFAAVNIKQDFLDQDVFERYKTFEPGEVYSTTAIADLQRDLYNSGYIKTIDVDAKPNHKDKNVPVDFNIIPKKRKRHRFAIGYGTDSGIRLRYDFDWRWANRRGHHFKSRLFASEKLQEGGVEYHIPGRRPATDFYKLFADSKRDRSGDIDSTLWRIGGSYIDQKGNLTREFGIKWQQEDFTIGNDSGNVALLTPYVHFTYRKADNLLETNDGILLDTWFTAGHKSALSDITLFQAIGRAKYIKRLGEPHKITLAGAAGRTWTDDFHQLPSVYRFFTGGDRTIRGYRYEIIGDRDSSGAIVGGDQMFYGSAEYEYFFKPKMAVAAFIDAGDAYSEGSANIKLGAGLGFHYYSPIGPIKVDVAHGFDEPGNTVRLHLVIGPDL